MCVKKPHGVLLIWLAILVVLAVIAKKTLLKNKVFTKTEWAMYVWSWLSLLIAIFLLIVWAHLTERSQFGSIISKPAGWNYWNGDYDQSIFDKELYLDAWRTNFLLTDGRYSDTTSIIYLAPLLIAIASVGVFVSLKYEALRTPCLIVQTSLLTYTLLSSTNKIGADNTEITNAKVGYTVTHGALALIPFVLLFSK